MAGFDLMQAVQERRPELEAVLKPVPAEERERFIVLTVKAINDHTRLPHKDGNRCNCTQASMVQCVIDCASMVLEPGTGEELMYLWPYRIEGENRLTARPSYKGLTKNALRRKAISHIRAELVRKGDKFDPDYMNADPRHKRGKKRGEIEACWVVAWLPNGLRDIEVLELDDIKAIKRAAERSGNGKISPAWREFEGEMIRKSAFRRLLKRHPGFDDEAIVWREAFNRTLEADNKDYKYGGGPEPVEESGLDEMAESLAANHEEQQRRDPAPPPPQAKPKEAEKPKEPVMLTPAQVKDLLGWMVRQGFDPETLVKDFREISGYNHPSLMPYAEMDGFLDKAKQKSTELGPQST